MSGWTGWIALAVLIAATVIVATPVIRSEWTRHRRRPLPHRPAHGTPPPPGARHRQDQAHTASISATEILRAFDAGRRP